MKKRNIETESAGTNGPAFQPFIDKTEVGHRTRMRPRTIDDWMKRGLLPLHVGRAQMCVNTFSPLFFCI
jgi:hypothetical protein